MKIAILCPNYAILNRGVEARVEHLKREFNKLYNWHADIFTLGETKEKDVISLWGLKDTSAANKFLFRVFRKIGIKALSEPGYLHNASLAIASFPALVSGDYDIIINFAGFWGGWIASIIRNFNGTPNIISGAGGIGAPDLDNAKTRPNIFIASSPFVEQWINNKLPKQKTILIPNFVDTKLFKPMNIKKEYDICFAGAMDLHKRPQLAIKAAAKANLSLLILGSGVIKDEVNALGKQLLGNRFKLITHIKHMEMPQYYNKCSVFTLPTQEEPFGLVFLEAMACNIPVVANDYPTTKWILQDAGICCDCDNIEEYANSLKEAKSRNFENRPLERARNFDMDIIIPQWKQVIEGLLSGKK